MVISSLQLTGFRSYVENEFELSSGVTIVVGPNASGKTNLLEALLVLAKGKSYRADTVDLVHHDTLQARLALSSPTQDRVVVIDRSGEKLVRELSVDGVVKSRWRKEDDLPVVLFEPEHMRMVAGSPTLRRAYIDGILETTVSGYKTALSRYTRCLTQRNSLLKHQRASDQQLFVWDIKLAEYALEIVTWRKRVSEKINERIGDYYAQIAGTHAPISLSYSVAVAVENYQSALLAALHKTHDTDRMRGFTGVGPHRDDIQLLLNDQPAAASASRGESRSIILSLKLSEMSLLEEAYNQKPLFLLDDVFSELDQDRQKALAKALAGSQTVLTTTNADTWVRFKSGHFETILLG